MGERIKDSWKVDHIGIACRDIHMAIDDYEKLGFVKSHEKIYEGRVQKVRIQFMHLEGTEIELLEPLDKEDEHNVLSSYLKTSNYKMYHLCYEVEDLDAAMDYLRNEGYRKLGKMWLDSAHGNRRMLFMYHKRIGVMEIAEREKE